MGVLAFLLAGHLAVALQGHVEAVWSLEEPLAVLQRHRRLLYIVIGMLEVPTLLCPHQHLSLSSV